jgi:hypothetical protein
MIHHKFLLTFLKEGLGPETHREEVRLGLGAPAEVVEFGNGD